MSVRVWAPSLAMMCWTWVFTVCRLMSSAAAMSGLESPRATSSATWRSRDVRSFHSFADSSECCPGRAEARWKRCWFRLFRRTRSLGHVRRSRWKGSWPRPSVASWRFRDTNGDLSRLQSRQQRDDSAATAHPLAESDSCRHTACAGTQTGVRTTFQTAQVLRGMC